MRPTNRRLPLLLLLATLGSMAAAQDEPSSVTVETVSRGGLCMPSGRLKPACDEPTTTVVRVEKEVTFSLELPTPKTVYCAVTSEIEYTQRDTMVSVEGTIENKDCAASNGEYKLVASIRNANGELKTLDFLESWQRQDDQPVKFRGDYPIGENVDLVRVRTIQLRCTCTDTPAE